MMKTGRLKQFGISFLIVLSLLVSSISACACTHHHPEKAEQEKVETEIVSCHGTSHEAKPENHHQTVETPETVQTSISERECCVIQPAPQAVSKSENFKLEKQQPALLPKSAIEIKAVPQLVSVKTIEFEAPFYLSDSFYNISPSRGPPSRL